MAHIPGISAEILSILAHSRFEQILSSAELVAWALGGARQAELITFDSEGLRYSLSLDLEGWSNEPLMSPGVLLPGSWGNVPPGETFCCPDPESISGKICIDGSVPDRVLAPGQEVILTFLGGKLVGWEAPHGSPAVEFFEAERLRAASRGDLNWNTFAELGIGLNDAISTLTGKGLFDEKASETVHIAIGENTPFGHNIKSDIHADLVAWRPTLLLDGVELLERGILQQGSWAEKRLNWAPANTPLDPKALIEFKGAEIEVCDGQVFRRLCKAGRVGIVRMMDESGGRALYELTEILRGSHHASVADIVEQHPEIARRSSSDLIRVLHYYGVLTLL